MKTRLLHVFLLCFTISINCQNVWTGNVDDSWANENNWSGNVPEASDDVLIPPGFVVTIDTPANIRSIEVQGNSTLNVTEALIIAVDSEFEDNVIINWSSGGLEGPGILLNSGTINMSFPSFNLGGSVVLNNPGTINMVGGNIAIGSESVLNNSGTGIIDFKQDGGMFAATSGDLINFGTIKTSFPDPSGEAFMGCDIINQDGIFQIDSGTLNINNTVMNISGAEFNISAGAVLNLNSPMDVLGVLFGIVNGDLNWFEDMTVDATAVFNFTGNNTITNIGGDLLGGGTLTNLSTINLETGNLVIRDASTLDNNGIINLLNSSDLLINADGTVNNNTNGTISLLSNDASIGSLGIANDTRVLNNEGLIHANLPNTSDEASILIKLNNNDGQINVNNGQLNLNYGGITLTDGVYNIDTNGTLNWSFPITVTGTMIGSLNGILNWGADLIVTTIAAFDFSGNGIINWETSDLDGGGVFTNENTIIKPAGGSRRIDNGTTLNNNGSITLQGGGSISVATNSILNNTASGIIRLEIGNSALTSIGATPNTINNFGTIETDITGSPATISAQLNNSGELNIIQNGLTFNGAGSLINNASGVIKGNGTLTLTNDPNDFVNNGTVSPGASPGTLTIVNEFNSSPTSILQVELNGNNQVVNYDLLTIDGDANLDGNLDIILGFAPQINDEFIVLNTIGGDTIDQCDLPNTIMASFGGSTFEFDVTCRNNNELVLTVTSETLGVNFFEENSNIKIYPNPATDWVYFSDESINNIKVYDLSGKLITQNNSSSIFVKNLKAGLYLVEASNRKKNSVKYKLVKQ